MYEKILVPLDGSKVGEAALPYVEDLMSKLSPEVKLEIILLQVLSSAISHVTGGYAIKEYRNKYNLTKCCLAFCQDHLPLNCRNYILHAQGFV